MEIKGTRRFTPHAAFACALFVLVLLGVVATFADDPPEDPYIASDDKDVTGDEVDDPIVADPSASAGEVRVHSGTNGELTVTFLGKEEGDKFGFAVAVIDNLNGDAHKDLLIGAPKEQGGRAYAFFGPFDENCPMYLSAVYANYVIAAPDAGSFDFGAGLRGVPDLDEDRFQDLFVRASYSDAGGATSFKTHAYSGHTGAYLFSVDGDATYQPSGGGGGSAMGGGSGGSCYGDLTGPEGYPDGWINTLDLLFVINSWGECPALPDPCPADIAPRPGGDGIVNNPDMLAVMNAWGPCPVQGIVYQSNGTGGGDWFDPNTWDPPGVPGTQQHFDVAIILPGDTITQSQKYPFTLGYYTLSPGATHVFSTDAEIAALCVEPFGEWARSGDFEPVVVVRNARRAFPPWDADIERVWDCPVFCSLLNNPYYPYSTLEPCQTNPCEGGSP